MHHIGRGEAFPAFAQSLRRGSMPRCFHRPRGAAREFLKRGIGGRILIHLVPDVPSAARSRLPGRATPQLQPLALVSRNDGKRSSPSLSDQVLALATGKTQQEITTACKGARPNHVGAAISRHKRAGHIEERDGKLYAT